MDVYTGPKGFLSDGNLLRPQLFIDSSTIDPQTSRTVSKAISGCKLKEDRGMLSFFNHHIVNLFSYFDWLLKKSSFATVSLSFAD